MDQLINEDPELIGPYRLIGRLGAGGMGRVYLARAAGGRTVAVKVVQAEYAENVEFRKRFAREVGAARRVGGDWTAGVLDADTEAAVPWVATQYIPGPDLGSVVGTEFGPLPEHTVRVLANRLALALGAVHDAGLLHRDLKPSNILITVDGPKVIDFGIARALDSLGGDSLLTHTGMLIGSPGFMSPEQVRGLELGPASDVFCLGAVLVYAATGRLLFGATDSGLNAHLFRIAEEQPDMTGVPESLLPLVRDCLDKDPSRRPSPAQIAERTADDVDGSADGVWLPGAVLAQLGRHAAQLLDFGPETRPTPTTLDAGQSAPVPTALDAGPMLAAQPTQTAPPPPALPPVFGPAPAANPAPRRNRPRTVGLASLVTVLALIGAGLAVLKPWAGTNEVREGSHGAGDGPVTVPGGSKKQGKDAGKAVNLGYFPWDEAIATTYLWQNILEDRGYKPKVKQLDPGPLYTDLSQGQMDVQFDSWLPNTHKDYWDRYKDQLTDIGSWYGPTSLELSVPSYVEGIDSLEDLKGQGKKFNGKIIGIEASTGIMKTLNEKVLTDYGLEGEYEVVSSSTSSMLAELDRSIQKKEPVVVTLWSPHWAYGKHDLKKLKDPKGAWGEGDMIHTVGKKDFAKDFPELNGWLKNFKLTEEQLASLEVEIQKGGAGKEKESARHWMDAHPDVIDKLAPVKD
ncbi:glycine betaine ABC transporter substrate-binding protein [Streptomyces sp. CBMA152]|uniref:glycine betaine ABC transporter substrate-binding protein n=1 Tax=Streptomyces sp. CBMA152 TaxID=1896312 RepID=UPI002948C33E|nr:glycine betaine ABC transporter substrate-binding protein [Streptomyces sp. CBMA152]